MVSAIAFPRAKPAVYASLGEKNMKKPEPIIRQAPFINYISIYLRVKHTSTPYKLWNLENKTHEIMHQLWFKNALWTMITWPRHDPIIPKTTFSCLRRVTCSAISACRPLWSSLWLCSSWWEKSMGVKMGQGKPLDNTIINICPKEKPQGFSMCFKREHWAFFKGNQSLR